MVILENYHDAASVRILEGRAWATKRQVHKSMESGLDVHSVRATEIQSQMSRDRMEK